MSTLSTERETHHYKWQFFFRSSPSTTKILPSKTNPFPSDLLPQPSFQADLLQPIPLSTPQQLPSGSSDSAHGPNPISGNVNSTQFPNQASNITQADSPSRHTEHSRPTGLSALMIDDPVTIAGSSSQTVSPNRDQDILSPLFGNEATILAVTESQEATVAFAGNSTITASADFSQQLLSQSTFQEVPDNLTGNTIPSIPLAESVAPQEIPATFAENSTPTPSSSGVQQQSPSLPGDTASSAFPAAHSLSLNIQSLPTATRHSYPIGESQTKSLSPNYTLSTAYKNPQSPAYFSNTTRSISNPEGTSSASYPARTLAPLPPYPEPPVVRKPIYQLSQPLGSFHSPTESSTTCGTALGTNTSYCYSPHQPISQASPLPYYHQKSSFHITYYPPTSPPPPPHQSPNTLINTSASNAKPTKLAEGSSALVYQPAVQSTRGERQCQQTVAPLQEKRQDAVKVKSSTHNPTSLQQPMVHSARSKHIQDRSYSNHDPAPVLKVTSKTSKAHEITFSTVKFTKRTSSLFRNKNHSSKGQKSQGSTSTSSSQSSRKHKDKSQMRKNNMFHRLKAEGPSTYILPSKHKGEDSNKKALQSPTTPPGAVTFPELSPTPIISVTPAGSCTSNTSSTFSYSLKHQMLLHQQQQGLVDLLTCPVCLEDYQGEGSGREPLFLSCHHSICRACQPKLGKLQAGKYSSHAKESNEISCPECRVVTQIPSNGLIQNFYLVSLLETKRKKQKEPSSRLRMWCRECNDVALESCTSHNVIHLSSILSNYVSTYSSSKKHITKYLHKRAKHKGEEAREIKEAVENLDLATASLRRRLVAQLDYATLAQATANSLLQEVEQMCRRVGLEDYLDATPRRPEKSSSPSSSASDSSTSRKISAGGLGAEVMSSLLLESSAYRELHSEGYDEIINSPKGVDLLMFENFNGHGKDTTVGGGAGQSYNSLPYRHHQRRSPSKDDNSAVSSPAGSRPPSSRTSPVMTRKPSFDHLGSDEQEAKIMLLKECVKSIDRMEESLKKEETAAKEKLLKAKSSGDTMPKETLMEMFSRAVNSLT